MFSTKKEYITVIHDGRIFFLREESRNRWAMSGSLSLDAFAVNDITAKEIPKELKGMKHRMMVVADYWFENTVIPFQSKKRSFIEPYLTRRIKEQYPDQKEAGFYFDYTATTTAEGMPGLYAFFLKDPLFFQIISIFRGLDMEPERVTSSGYLLQHLCAESVTGFLHGGKVLVQVMEGLCYIAIYVDGLFLFSRFVTLPPTIDGASPDYDEVVYEITQSLYLVSQKAKKEVEDVYLHSADEAAFEALSTHFGAKLKNLADASLKIPHAVSMPEIGPMAGLMEQGLLPKDSFPWIAHIEERHEAEWATFQKMGIATGAIAALLLGGLFIYLAIYPGLVTASMPEDTETRIADVEERLEEYRSALSGTLDRKEALPAETILSALGLSLPPSFHVQKIHLANEKGGTIDVEGWLWSDSTAALEQSLAGLVDRLHQRFPASFSFRLRDIEINGEQQKEGKKRFQVHFSFTHS